MRDALMHASFVGFTDTLLELEDRNTRAVFGDYIFVYDIQRAVEDGATVPIYYEARLSKLQFLEELKPRIDEEFEEVTERARSSSTRNGSRPSGRRRGGGWPGLSIPWREMRRAQTLCLPPNPVGRVCASRLLRARGVGRVCPRGRGR